MDFSTIVYIVGALAYMLLRRQFKSQPTPSPGPVDFPPPKAPLPLPNVPAATPPLTGTFNSRQSHPGPTRPGSVRQSQYSPLFREGSERFSTSESLSVANTTTKSEDQILMETEDLQANLSLSKPTHFRKPDQYEWRRAIILSTLLEPRYDRGLNQ